jgi:hypothetical protein
MAQQINLLDPALQPRADALGASRGLMLVAAVFIGSSGLAAGLQWQAARLQAGLPPMGDSAAAPASPASAAHAAALGELQRLRALDQQQQQLRTALASGAAGSVEGYTPYLRALSRQAQGSLWLTGFAVAAEGNAVELEGRMTDASLLPAYLKRLNAEPLFHGRPFAELRIRSLDAAADGGAGHSQFTLRSTPAAPAAPASPFALAPSLATPAALAAREAPK